MKLKSIFLKTFLMISLGTSYAHSHEKVALCQIVEHAALNQMREGIKESLKDMDIEWTHENAQGNSTLAVQVAQKVTGDNYDLIIALATPMAQAIAGMNSKTPILFGAVSDPLSAKLVSSLEQPGDRISGVIDQVPAQPILSLVQRITPDARHIGLIYNSGEANSVAQATEFKTLARKSGYTISEATVSRSSDVLSATKSLLGKVDVIVLPTDNTVISALEAITKPAAKHNVPVIGVDVDTVRRGALAAIGVDWRHLGQQLGKMAKEVLTDKSMQGISVQGPDKYHLHINLKTAQAIGLRIDLSLIEDADKVYNP